MELQEQIMQKYFATACGYRKLQECMSSAVSLFVNGFNEYPAAIYIVMRDGRTQTLRNVLNRIDTLNRDHNLINKQIGLWQKTT